MAPASNDVPEPGERARSPLFPTSAADQVRAWLRWIGPRRLLAAAGASLVVAGVGWWLLRSPSLPTEANLPRAERADAAQLAGGSDVSTTSGTTTTASVPPSSAATVVVHVAGAVAAPGVYELAAGDRVADAIAAAGGATAGADPDALNLAAPVADGDRVAVPVAGEAAATDSSGHMHAAPPGDGSGAATIVNINEAGAAELEALPGVGPATATAIVEHRERNGPFASADDLEDVHGIGPAKLDAIRDFVTV